MKTFFDIFKLTVKVISTVVISIVTLLAALCIIFLGPKDFFGAMIMCIIAVGLCTLTGKLLAAMWRKHDTQQQCH